MVSSGVRLSALGMGLPDVIAFLPVILCPRPGMRENASIEYLYAAAGFLPGLARWKCPEPSYWLIPGNAGNGDEGAPIRRRHTVCGVTRIFSRYGEPGSHRTLDRSSTLLSSLDLTRITQVDDFLGTMRRYT